MKTQTVRCTCGRLHQYPVVQDEKALDRVIAQRDHFRKTLKEWGRELKRLRAKVALLEEENERLALEPK